jgi:tryptophan synthase alpha chain
LVYLLAPTSPPERIELLANRSTGFLYLVSLTGVTGARDTLPPHLADFVQRVRAVARTPLAVGFGISTPEQARAVGQIADGVIVGSALIKAAGQSQSPAQAAAAFVHRLRQGLNN